VNGKRDPTQIAVNGHVRPVVGQYQVGGGQKPIHAPVREVLTVHGQAADGPAAEPLRQYVDPLVTGHRAVAEHDRIQGVAVGVQQVVQEPGADGVVVDPEPPQPPEPGVQELKVELHGKHTFHVRHVQHVDVHGAKLGERVLIHPPDPDTVQHQRGQAVDVREPVGHVHGQIGRDDQRGHAAADLRVPGAQVERVRVTDPRSQPRLYVVQPFELVGRPVEHQRQFALVAEVEELDGAERVRVVHADPLKRAHVRRDYP